jgi:phosphatidylglycerophosphate synthase
VTQSAAGTRTLTTPRVVISSLFELVSSMKEVPRMLLLVTLGRFLFIPVVILSFDDSPLITAAALAVFIAADLYDGVLARKLGADDPARRVLDSLVDRASIWLVYMTVTAAGLLPPAFLVVLLARDLYCGYLCHKIVHTRNVVICADWAYRGLNLMLAGWVVIAPLVQAQARLGLFAGILLVSAAVAVDLKRSVAAILQMPSSVASVVIPAGDIRRMRRGSMDTLRPVIGPLFRSA